MSPLLVSPRYSDTNIGYYSPSFFLSSSSPPPPLFVVSQVQRFVRRVRHCGWSIHLHEPFIDQWFKGPCKGPRVWPGPLTLCEINHGAPPTGMGTAGPGRHRKLTLKNHVLLVASYCSIILHHRYIPFIHRYCRICTYVHLLYMYIHHIYNLTHL